MNASLLLKEYPALWNRLQSQRERIINSYHACLSDPYSRGGGGLSDPTANRAMKLLKVDAYNQVITLTQQWIDTELESEDRPLLLNVWRGRGIPRIRMNQMEQSLKEYLIRSAGHARDEPGAVCVNGQSVNEREYSR